MKPKRIVQIDLKCHISGEWGAKIYRIGKLMPTHYNNITLSSMMRVQRAQYALAGWVS